MNCMEILREKIQKLNSNPIRHAPGIRKIRKRIWMQASIAVASIMLMAILVFSMTAAWYTNVAKTGGLTFEAEAWGFEADKITLSDATITVMPGGSGIIPLQVDNSTGTDTVEIGVTISKVLMDDIELQKRIFFYADTSKTYTFSDEDTDDETVSRIYIGASERNPYTYTLFPGQKLTLSEDYYSDVPIRWEWVYDMLGYYFYGTVDQTEGVVVEEYIRPIEYDYENAIFDQDETSITYQQLLAVGETKLVDFLAEFSTADGYAGMIDPTKAEVFVADNNVNRLYYPVAVDENGQGVWAYLSLLGEIISASEYDSGLAASEESVTAKAAITITASNVAQVTEEVLSEAELAAALEDPDVENIKLAGDVTVSSLITVDNGNDTTVDLSGYTLVYNGTETTYDMFRVTNGSGITVLNGTIQGNGTENTTTSTDNSAFRTVGGEVVLSNVTISDVETAVSVEDYTQALDSSIRISGCEIDTTDVALFIQGNGSRSEQTTKILIEDSTITSGYAGIFGQGNSSAGSERWGTELILSNSTVEGYWAGIYHPQQQSTIVISGSTIKGYTGIALKGGTMKVINSKVEGTGAYKAAAASGSGWTDTGDGIYVEAVYGWAAGLTIEGESEISSKYGYALQLFGQTGKGPGRIAVHGGTYTGTTGAAHWNEIGSFEIYAGTYNDAVDNTITRWDLTGE